MGAARKKLLASLTSTIEDWLAEVREWDEWDETVEFIGDDTGSFMADAAFAVLLAAAESPRHALEQGMKK